MVQPTPGTANTAPTGGAPQASSMSKGLLATLAGGGLLVVFVVQNRDDVTLNFLFWSFTVPMWLFTIVVAVLGSIVWIGLGILRRHRRRKARRAARDD
jgi:uncharacterized integral membrane protein